MKTKHFLLSVILLFGIGAKAQDFQAKLGASFINFSVDGKNLGPATYSTYFGFGWQVPLVSSSKTITTTKTVDNNYSVFNARYWDALVNGQPSQKEITTTRYVKKTYLSLTPEIMFNYGRMYETIDDTRHSYKINQILFPAVIKIHPNGKAYKGLNLQIIPMGTYMMGFNSRTDNDNIINLKKTKDVNSLGFSLGAGVGYSFGGFAVEARYNKGMTDVYWQRESRLDMWQITFLSVF